ncbi:tubulin polyglutamylase TTLL5 isoform X1 [Pangasianodon hypophthalmus]|uniref:tubulin polyglutamylase TTLL5 isoform X1 n=1 Tax=Pangasianodon hypophthalmus TaxID=310915 RepID=UPI002307D8EA|nr:tubulin polyglutamylase TTLL5 isoform X1 [Pangasianodon hypophthalmus]
MPAVSQDKEDSQSPSEEELECHPCIAWSGISRKIPVLLFHAEAIVSKEETICSVGERYNLAFKIVRTESRLVRSILVNHGFHEVHPNSNDFNLMWTGSHLKTYLLRSLQDFQKVNHFPRSNELTRKDRLYKNIQRMQQAHGFQNFHIVPQTFVLPAEYQEFCNAFCKDKGPWIIKPVASSRGRGIYLVSSPSQISLDENILVSRYISNPLLIDDFKFDVRLYVLVTSYDPVIIYVYEEGLTRFATVKYDHAVKNIKNQFMHLTNYSVNKKSSDYVSCDDPEVEDYGNKWSMSAMLRYLKQEGKDTTLLMGQIEDLIIKAVLSAELQIATACKMFVPHRNNCFELYGFDVLIDSNLKPWLLEVNLSPSLACDTPLDLKIKASMISDMFSLVGIVCQDPLLKQMRSEKAGLDPTVKNHKTQHHFFTQAASAKSRVRPHSANNIEELKEKQGSRHVDTLGLTAEELKVLRRTQEEHERRGGFIRIFPTPQTWELYSRYLEYKTSMNSMLANKLFHGRSEKSSVTTQFRNRLKGNMPLEEEAYKTCHVVQYESKLLSLEARRHRKRHTTSRATPRKRKTGRRPLPSSAHSSENEEADEREERGPQGKQEHTMSLAHTDPQPTLLERHRTEEHFPARVSKPKVDLLHILQQGWDLSKVQARMAFSSYLHRVQMRLLVESRTNSTPAWEQKDNDQMELVMRFLMRAASNLQQGMQVVLPSRQLSLPDRRRILAHQLGEFIHCYNQETEQMAKSLEKTEDEDRCISSNVFREFILEASESDLEDVLTFYTHKNKSASVFLGSSRRDRNKECSNSSGEPAKHHSRRNLLNSKEGSSASGLSLTAKADSPKNAEIQESVTRPGYNKSSITVNMNSHSNTIQNSDKYSTLNNGGHKNNKIQNGNTVTEGQPEASTAFGTQTNESKTRGLQDGEFWNKSSHITVVGNDDELSKMVNDVIEQPETAKNCKSQVKAQGSQHTSSYRAALDCEHIHLQQCFPRSEPEAQPQAQPPPYIHPPPHLHADSQREPQTTLSSSNTNCLRPTRVMWASSNSRSPRSFATTEVLQQSQGSQMAQLVTSGVSSSTACTTNMYSQTVLWPSSAVQVSNKASKARPASAGMFKEPDSLSAQAQSNHQAIVAALKKLVEKQAARQYSTSSHISLLTQHLTNLNLAKGVFSRGAQSVTSGARPDTATTQHSGMNLSGAVSSHRKDAGDGKCQSTCNLSTGATLQPASGSYQLQFAIQQLQQQKLQSRKLLDQSRSRHQAMLDGHTFVPGAVPRNPVPASCSVQVDSQSQTSIKQTASWRDSCHPEPLVPTRGAATLIPKPPSSTPKETLSRKTATQRTNQQAPYVAPSGNGLSSRQNVVYDTTCGKMGLSVYSKVFDAQRSRPR